MKKLFALLLAMIMVCSLCVCGTAAFAEETEIEPCELRFTYWADDTDKSALMQDIVAKFNAENEYGITVIAEEQPWNGGGYSTDLFNTCMGGGSPDIATWKLTATPMFVNNDLLADLTPFLESWEGKSDIDDNLWDVMQKAGGVDGATYVMPWNVQVLYTYYRPSYFEEAGIEVPTTYEELLAAIEKCTVDKDGDGTPDVYGWGMRGASGGQEPWGCFMTAYGGTFEDFTTEEAVKGMQDFIDIYTKGFCPPTATGDGFAETVANFKSGLTAMFIHHIGSSKGMVEELGDDVDAFIFPGTWTSMGDTETVIFEECENKAAAFEFVKYMATGEGQVMWCEGTGQVPVSKTVQQMDYFQNDKFMKVSAEGMGIASPLPILDTTTELVSEWPNLVGQALTGAKTAEETMEAMQAILYN